nr:hypothetical protein Q903MT_gene4881 [Picea sitchensis]
MLLLVEVVVGKLVIYLLLLNRQDLLYLLMMYLPLLLWMEPDQPSLLLAFDLDMDFAHGRISITIRNIRIFSSLR